VEEGIMEGIFSPQKVNCGRQLELDVARALAVAYTGAAGGEPRNSTT